MAQAAGKTSAGARGPQAAGGDVPGAESGTELLARLEGRSSLKEIDPTLFAAEDSQDHGAVVELHGPEGAGKTELLYRVTARCLLPREAGGLGAEALFLDADGHFDLLRLVAVLERGGAEELVRGCLGRLWVLRCASSAQLLLTLHALPALLCRRPALGLLALDGLSAFYWLDRAGGGESARLQEAPLRQCVQLLQRLAAAHRLQLFVTTQSLLQPRPPPAAGDPGHRPYLCQAWRRAVTHRLLLSRHGDGDGDAGPRFSVLVRHLRSGASRRLAFTVGDGGLQFCGQDVRTPPAGQCRVDAVQPEPSGRP
ncbi:DNA repair protein XRCC2 [Sorex araneus]|uniref:DNA repair protein XRCC2 n=1 Tax=Sorex araneus TaxID=42254 RepID=UPI002433FA07|nr:DNA repair protein XRCC2 [Sorex araneus]